MKAKIRVPRVTVGFLLISLVVLVLQAALPAVLGGHLIASYISLSPTFIGDDIFTISGLFLYPFFTPGVPSLLYVGFFLIFFGYLLESSISSRSVILTLVVAALVGGIVFLIVQNGNDSYKILLSAWVLVYGYSTALLGFRIRNGTLFERKFTSWFQFIAIVLCIASVLIEGILGNFSENLHLIAAMVATFLLHIFRPTKPTIDSTTLGGSESARPTNQEPTETSSST